MSLAPAKAAIQQPASNAQDNAHDVRDPVVKVGAPVEAGLDEFDGTPKGARADEHWQQANAARAREREGERGEGDEVDEFVSAIWCGLLTNWPEHRDGQGEGHGERQGDVEVLAHSPGCIEQAVQRQVQAFDSLNRG